MAAASRKIHIFTVLIQYSIMPGDISPLKRLSSDFYVKKYSFLMFPVLKLHLSLLKCNCSHDPPKIKCNCLKSYLEIIHRKQIAKIHRPHSLISNFLSYRWFQNVSQFFLVKTSSTCFYTNKNAKTQRRKRKTINYLKSCSTYWPKSLSSFIKRGKNVNFS